MPTTYVALDLETTGLDSERDSIIEVAARRFDLAGPGESFETFVDPKRPIPYRIQRLTSISDGDVAGAPSIAEVASTLEEFIGDAAVVGQNIAFDLGFLARANVVPPGPPYDTQELAGVLLPRLVEQNLQAIARHLEIEFPVRHRALADADAARMVFLELRGRLAMLPFELLAEAERVAAATQWPLRHLLRDIMDETPNRQADGEAALIHGAVRPPQPYGQPLRNGTEEPQPIDADEIESLLTTVARNVIDGFEERPQQVAMSRAVTRALNQGEQLLLEAGTGIGKSLAYLLPSAGHALRNGTRVAVSTNTINLQEQLMREDIPHVRRLLQSGGGDEDELRAAQLKGRRNYLCLLRWSDFRRSMSLSTEEAKLLVRLLLWLPHTDDGDRAELRLSQSEETVWSRLSSQNQACISARCVFARDGSCFLLRARRRAEAAHVLIVNHALLLSDIAVGGGVIPEYAHLIVDEAQHLEREATSQFGFQAREDDVTGLLDNVAGLVGGLRAGARGPAAQAQETKELLHLGDQAAEAAAETSRQLPDFFRLLADFVRQQTPAANDYGQRLLLTHSMRVQPDWSDVEVGWETVNATLGQVVSALETLESALETGAPESLLEHESLVGDVADLVQTGRTLRAGMETIVLRDDPNTVCWLTQQRSDAGISLASAPLRVAEILEERLYAQKDTTVLTSATLSVDGHFGYVRQTLGLSDAHELLLGSPFDYEKSTLVLVPQDLPEPNHSGYMKALQQSLIELVRASNGRALVLFTSHGSLRAAHDGIKKALEEEQILVLGHNVDGSPRQLLRGLQEQSRTVVLGTASFWEGIDVVGEALSLLVIARLPFSVPDDPIFQARSDLYDDPFNEYAVPQAALRFKQGFGRLIRRKTDRGVMVVLDGRIHTKRYGEAFLGSLPQCTLRRVTAREMPGLVGAWLSNKS